MVYYGTSFRKCSRGVKQNTDAPQSEDEELIYGRIMLKDTS